MDGFTHLHVASGFSMRYGASMPEALVARAVELGLPALALTDRDGLYGAVRFVRAASAAGVAPVLGVDLAVEHEGVGGVVPARGRRAPARGGVVGDLRLPRVTVLARGRGGGVEAGRGWAALCRLVTETHLRGERGTPVTTPWLVGRWCRGGVDPGGGGAGVLGAVAGTGASTGASRLLVLLGPDSDVGRALLARHNGLARARLEAWRRLLPEGGLVVEVVHHGGPQETPGSRVHAARLLGLADEVGVPAVLSGAVRHLTRDDVRIVDVLDAARRLVVLDSGHLDQVTDAGHLASEAEMRRRASEVVLGVGPVRGAACDQARVERLLVTTAVVAASCVLDPRHDLGIGSVHLPEPEVLGIAPGTGPQRVLAERVRAAVATRYPHADAAYLTTVRDRLEDELAVIGELGYATYFLTVAEVVDLVKERGVRVAARGSGAGSLVNYLLGVSGVDPVGLGLLMERFCTTLRAELPDIDIDVESARRTEIYEAVLARFGGERVTCVSMMDTYKVRQAVRDVGASLGLPLDEVDEIAKAFPHIRAKDARSAIADLPELRTRGLDSSRLEAFFELVERLDGLPRHIALHPCGVVLSNAGLLDRTPVEASWRGFPMSQFDKDDVEALGLLKLDILGVRMQSAMAHAVAEVSRVDGVEVDLDAVPLDDEATFALVRTTHTLGCFQIESPGQRELVGKLGPGRFLDLVIDISLFRPGPVKSDMVTPFLERRHGWDNPDPLHPSLVPVLADTEGVVVFHEQVLQIIAETTGVSLAQADEVRRRMGSPAGQQQIEAWWRLAARARGYTAPERDRIWEVLRSFASFGFCKAHAAAFALPTYQSAWLKAHHPAAFLAGILTHDPGMYPKRLILAEARSLGIAVLGLDINASSDTYRVEALDETDRAAPPQDPDLPDGTAYGIRLSLADVSGISAAEVARIVAGQPYADLGDFWTRTRVSRPVLERLVVTGGFDAMHGIGGDGLGRRGRVTRRDLLLHVAELDRWDRTASSSRRRAFSPPPRYAVSSPAAGAALNVRGRAAAQSQAAAPVAPAATQPVQLALDLGDRPELRRGSGLREMSGLERVRAELDVLGLDASAHIMTFYEPLLTALGVTRSRDILGSRNRSEILVAGVKVATQTPPVRSGRRVIFLTVDDGTGPADATFFEDVQGPYAATVFHSWLLLVRGVIRRTGASGVSLRATGAWELTGLWETWRENGIEAVHDTLTATDALARERADEGERMARENRATSARRVLVHASGFRQSPYADTRPAGLDPREGHGLPTRKLWHSSLGSSGH